MNRVTLTDGIHLQNGFFSLKQTKQGASVTLCWCYWGLLVGGGGVTDLLWDGRWVVFQDDAFDVMRPELFLLHRLRLKRENESERRETAAEKGELCALKRFVFLTTNDVKIKEHTS